MSSVDEHPRLALAETHPGATPAAAAEPIGAERPLTFTCEDEQLLGILHPASGVLGVVVVVGGPQVRAGSHRQFVHMARALAAAGHPVLRFDVRGMGDSTGDQRNFEQITPDIGTAIDALMAAQPQLRGVVLWGLCDGASAALLYLHDRPDPRVLGLCLLNPWARSEQTLAQARVRHYYWQRLRQGSFWLKLLRGQVRPSAGLDLVQQVQRSRAMAVEPENALSFQQRMLVAWQAFEAPVLLILSGKDLTAQEFLQHTTQVPAWGLNKPGPWVQIEHVAEADHTFSAPQPAALMQQRVVDWVDRLAQATGALTP